MVESYKDKHPNFGKISLLTLLKRRENNRQTKSDNSTQTEFQSYVRNQHPANFLISIKTSKKLR